MNLADLRASLVSYLHRTDLDDAELDRFVEFGAARIAAIFRPPIAEQSAIVTLVGTIPGVFLLPTNYLSMRSVFWKTGDRSTEIKPLSPIEVQKWDVVGAAPLGYTIGGLALGAFASLIYTFPRVSPGLGGLLSVNYYQAPAKLTSGTSTNYLTAHFERLITYAALIEAAIWERDTESVTLFQGLYADALTDAKVGAERARYGAGPVAASNYQAPTGITRSM